MIRQLGISRGAIVSCACLALAVVLAGSSAKADNISFDPDGPAGGNGSYTVSTFDFAPGNALLAQIGSLLVDKQGKFTQFALQASMDNLIDGNGNPLVVPGMGSTFELTVAFGFEGTADVNGALTTFGLNGPSFFEVLYDNNPLTKANNLTGKGFRDGTVILTGVLSEASGTLLRHSGTTRFDQFPSSAPADDDYAGLQTHQVIGGASVTAQVTYADPNFFGQVPPALQLTFFNSSLITPFGQADPSREYWGQYFPNPSPVNGEGFDFQMQGDANATFVVPEPSSIALAALGLVGIVLARRKRTA